MFGMICFGKKFVVVEDIGSDVCLMFVDGSVEMVDIVIGVDGVNLCICEYLFGVELLCYIGYVVYCVVFLVVLFGNKLYDMCVKWWLEDCYMMVYYVIEKCDEYYYVIGVL